MLPADLDNPDHWRAVVEGAFNCPMGPSAVGPAYIEFLARQHGVDPHRAAAMVATFYFPGDTRAVH